MHIWRSWVCSSEYAPLFFSVQYVSRIQRSTLDTIGSFLLHDCLLYSYLYYKYKDQTRPKAEVANIYLTVLVYLFIWIWGSLWFYFLFSDRDKEPWSRITLNGDTGSMVWPTWSEPFFSWSAFCSFANVPILANWSPFISDQFLAAGNPASNKALWIRIKKPFYHLQAKLPTKAEWIRFEQFLESTQGTLA